MKTKILQFAKSLGWATIRTMFFIAFWAVWGVRNIFSGIEWALRQLCIKTQVFEISNPSPSNVQYEPTFTPEELESMAMKIKDNGMTIEQIKNFFKVSYRQARKIKEQVNIHLNSPVIRRISA